MKQAVQLTIMGQQYSIRSSRSFDEVQHVAAFVDARIAEILDTGATANTMNATVLAFLNVAGSYLELQNQLDDSQNVSDKLHRLDDKLSAALTTET
ncbi:MAG: cell division protein ZapA [Thermodesulfobacteriota bacterium]|nr:cell division protein ZapA [Thermodesulfobacteriota bacterium]